MSRPEALRRLLGECLVLPELLDRAGVGSLVRWIRTVECFELPMSSLVDAVGLVKRHCGLPVAVNRDREGRDVDNMLWSAMRLPRKVRRTTWCLPPSDGLIAACVLWSGRWSLWS